MNKASIKSSKTVLESSLFHVVQSELVYPSGRLVTHHDIYRQPTVSVFPITPTYEIYLVTEYRYLLKKTMLEAMAGFMNTNETPLAAAKRELQEETGLKAEQWELLRTIDMAASVIKAQSHLFLAKGLEEGIATPEEDEDITLIKMPLEEAVQKVMTGEITTSASTIGILLLDRLRKEKKL